MVKWRREKLPPALVDGLIEGSRYLEAMNALGKLLPTDPDYRARAENLRTRMDTSTEQLTRHRIEIDLLTGSRLVARLDSVIQKQKVLGQLLDSSTALPGELRAAMSEVQAAQDTLMSDARKLIRVN
jgi:hypothetical protein